MKPTTIIAIDGTSASGKGTIAKKLAQHLDFAHLDTGVLYRAVALLAMRKNVKDEAGITAIAAGLTVNDIMALAEDPELRSGKVGAAASPVAQIQPVRDALLTFQKDFCKQPPNGKVGAVLDGRDIGTVIAPDATVKLYVDAALKERARRRFLELQDRGESVTEAHVLADLQERDTRDGARNAAARSAKDVCVIDTTHLNAEQAFAEALRVVEAKL